jgi:HEAT repeat protein
MRSVLLVVMVASLGCGDASPPAPTTSPYTATLDVSALVRQLDTEETFDADEAAAKLAGLGEPVLPALEAALAREGETIRVGIVEALGQMESPRALEVLARVARSDPAPVVRGSAVLALGQSGEASVRPALEAALADPSIMASGTAAVVCGGICTTPAAIDRLVEIALGPLPEAELSRMRGSFARLLDGDPAAASHARECLRARAPEALDPSRPLLERARIAMFAMQAGVAGMEPVLVDAVRSGSATGARTAALETLARLGSAAAVPALEAAAHEPETAVAALRALQAIAARGIPEATAALAAAATPNAGTVR